jgi:hypothetical protein
LEVSYTWDFANGTLTYTVSGDGVGYTGDGSSAFSDTRTVAADLSGITNVKSMRVRGNTVGAGEYIDLDSVTLATGTAGSTGGGDSVLITETTFDEWSFTSGTPQTSDTLSKSMGSWDPALADTSVPSAGLLRDATAGNSTGAFYGDNLSLTAMPDAVTLTVAIADINHTDRDYWFEFLGTTGGNMRGEINAFNGNVSIDVEGGGTALMDVATGHGSVFNVANYTGAISLEVSYTWDFANNTLTYTVSGDGVGYTGDRSSAFSDTQTVAADLSGITNVKSMRVRGNTVGAGEYIDLDSVTIATGTAGSTGGGDGSTALDTWTFTDSAVPQTSDTLSKSMGSWDPALADTSVPSAGLLRDATAGNSTSAWYGDNLSLAQMPDAVTLTVAIADINHTDRDYWFEFLGTVGGTTRLDIDAFNGNIFLDVWGAGTELSGPAFVNTAEYTGAISMTVVATWDFANSTLSYTVSGDGVGYTGTGSSAFSDTQTLTGAALSGITNVTSMRVRGNTVGAGEYIDLDSVTIATGTAGSTGGGDGSTGGGDGSTGGGDGSTGGGDGSTGGGDGSTGGGDGSTGGGDGSTGGVDPNLIPDGSVTLQANGANFDLVLSIEESSDLQTFTQMSLTGSEVTVDASTNTITISIDGSSNQAFYRITGQ